MRLKGLRLGLAAFTVVISLIGISLVATGYQLPWVHEKLEARRIRSELSDRSTELRQLQVAWDKDRRPIKDYFTASESVLRSARTPGGTDIDKARTEFASVPSLKIDAEKALKDLPSDSRNILTEARYDLKQVRRLRSLSHKTEELTYLAELAKALQLFVDSFVLFDKMNEPLARGMTLYARLNDQTKAFLDAESNGQFRNRSEAARSYSVSISQVSSDITALTGELVPLETAAVEKLNASKRSSQRAKELRPS